MRATSRRSYCGAVWLTLGAALAITACGGSDTLSKTDLVKKANGICDSSRTELKAIGRPPADFATNPAAAAAYLDKAVPLIKRAVDNLAALKPPSAIKSDWDMFTKALSQEAQLYKTAQTKAHAKDPSGLQDLAKTLDIRTSTTHPLEQKLGLTHCHA